MLTCPVVRRCQGCACRAGGMAERMGNAERGQAAARGSTSMSEYRNLATRTHAAGQQESHQPRPSERSAVAQAFEAMIKPTGGSSISPAGIRSP